MDDIPDSMAWSLYITCKRESKKVNNADETD